MAQAWFEGRTTSLVAKTVTLLVSSNTNTHTFIVSMSHPSGSSSTTVTILTVTADGILTTDQLASAICTAFNASTQRWATRVTASVSASTVTFTADNPGEDFVLSKSGTGTSTLTTTQANIGPSQYDYAGNWADGAIPGAADDVVVTGGASLLYGLGQGGVAIDSFTRINHTGTIGWPGMPLKIDPDKFVHNNPSGGVSYINIGTADFDPVIVHAGNIWPWALFLSGGNSSAEWTAMAGNLAIALSEGDTATALNLFNYGARIGIGPIATVTNYRQACGWCHDRQVANRTSVYLKKGEYIEELAGTLTTFTNNGAMAKMLGIGAITTANAHSGLTDFATTQRTRTVDQLNYNPNAVAVGSKIQPTASTPLGDQAIGKGGDYGFYGS